MADCTNSDGHELDVRLYRGMDGKDELEAFNVYCVRCGQRPTPKELKAKLNAHAAFEAKVKWLEMAVDYYKTGLSQTSKHVPAPHFIPKRIHVTKYVRSEMPGDRTVVEPGEYEALSNAFGAISIMTDVGKFGIKPGEFEVLEWQPNPALLSSDVSNCISPEAHADEK